MPSPPPSTDPLPEPPAQRRDPSVVRLGVVAYLNMQPLISSLETSPHAAGIELWHAPPARLVEWMERGLIDSGMLPVAALLDHPDWEIVGRSMIGARGPVLSVLALGPQPPQSWRRIAGDAHSRTSNLLARVILRGRYGSPAELLPTPAEGAWRLPATPVPGQANVLIGSHAFEHRAAWNGSQHARLDLGAEWFAWTGLPFVFAAWLARPGLTRLDWIDALEQQRRANAARIEAIVRAWPHLARENLSVAEGVAYLTRHIDYDLDDSARAGLRHFLTLARALDGPAQAHAASQQ